jgi:hypothetical protein
VSTSAQVARMSESQGGLARARSAEHLLRPDQDVYRMRQQIRAAFLLQQQGKRYVPGEQTRAARGDAPWMQLRGGSAPT